MRKVLLGILLLFAKSSLGQSIVNLTIGGKPVQLTQQTRTVAVRIVEPSESIAAKTTITEAFDLLQSRTRSAGLLGVAKAPSTTGALPSGVGVFAKTNQLQQIPVYRIAKSDVDIYLFPELIVQFKPGISDASARRLLKLYGAQSARSTKIPGRYLASMPQPQSVLLATNNMTKYLKEVLYAEPNFYFFHPSNAAPLTAIPSNPSPLSPSSSTNISADPAKSIQDPGFVNQWTLLTTPIDFGVLRVWSTYQTQGSNVKVAIIDDGVDLNHEDLKGAISDFGDTTSTATSIAGVQTPYTLQPEAQHGTACAGIIAAQINKLGTVGVAPSIKLIAIKAATYSALDNGQMQWTNDTAALADAIDMAIGFGADIISASWGIPDGIQSADITSAINRALNGANARRVLIFAGGNLQQGSSSPSFDMDFPASMSGEIPGVVSVAASTPCDVLKSFTSCDNDATWASKYLPQATILAPGTSMETTIPGNQYAYFSGTSAATPFLAGVVALLMSNQPTLTRSQILDRLRTNSRTITAPEGTFLRVDAYCLLLGDGKCGS
jgi:subtilisin family serine protease